MIVLPWQVEYNSHEYEIDGDPLVVRVVDGAVDVELVVAEVARARAPVMVGDPEIGVHPTIRLQYILVHKVFGLRRSEQMFSIKFDTLKDQ